MALATFLAVGPAGWAQQAQRLAPHIGYLYPAGGRQGTTFQVKVGGQLLDGVTNAHVSSPAVRVAVLEHVKPLTPQQFNTFREKLKELQQKRTAALKNGRRGGLRAGTNVFTAQDQKTFAEIRLKLAAYQRRPPNPAIAETVTLQVTLAADAEPGEHELRLRTPLGLSNPLIFCVGQLPEYCKKLPVIDEEPRRGKKPGDGNEPQSTAPLNMMVTLPVIINGQTMPGGVDRYHFQARKDQQLVVAASARELIPYLADAVPGWFQATLTLYDTRGKEVAYDDDFRFHPDPVLYYVIPRDGEYVVEVKDAIYRGREDFVYRITLGELPFVTSIFPLGGKAGEQTPVELKGWNLPVTSLTQNNQARGPGIYPVTVRKGELVSNHVPFAVDTLPDCLEQEPNNSPASAQAATLPIIVNGRINQPGDWDVFRFDGRAGDQLVAEVHARRLDSPLDSVLKLTDSAGRQLAFNDDHEDKGSGLNTHHADSYLKVALPANGTYYLHLGDTQRQGGPEYAYRLRLSSPQPDFALRVAPSSINARAGVSTPLTVYALRKDGFTNEIALALKDAPPGFVLSGARVPANQAQVRLTLAAPPTSAGEPLSLSLEGRATVQGRELVRPAIPAEDMMQAFAYWHLVPARELEAVVLGNARSLGRSWARIVGPMPVKIPAGGTARVLIAAPGNMLSERFQLELNDPPDGIAIEKISPAAKGAEMVLHCDAEKVKPGLKGNLIVNVLPGKNFGPAQKAKKQTNQRRPALGSLPAIPFEIVK